MKVQIKLYKAVIIAVMAIGLPAFAAGWVVAVNFSGVFETGYKMAFFDIRAAIRESVKDGQQNFYMNGIRFSPVKFGEQTALSDVKVCEPGVSDQFKQRELLLAQSPR